MGRLQWVQNYPGKVWTGRERGQHQKGKVKVGARWALEAAGLGSQALGPVKSVACGAPAVSEKLLSPPFLLPGPCVPPYPAYPSDSIFLSRSRSAGPGASALWLRNNFSSPGPLALTRGLGGT